MMFNRLAVMLLAMVCVAAAAQDTVTGGAGQAPVFLPMDHGQLEQDIVRLQLPDGAQLRFRQDGVRLEQLTGAPADVDASRAACSRLSVSARTDAGDFGAFSTWTTCYVDGYPVMLRSPDGAAHWFSG